MGDVPIMVCDCGKRLRAPGAVPGRTGRCPACGGVLRVPETAPRSTTTAALDDRSVAPDEDGRPRPESSLVPSWAAPPRKKRKRRAEIEAETTIWDGFVAAPKRPETRVRDSLLYPLWGATGVAALVILPPLLWVTSVMLFEGLTTLSAGGASPAGLLGLLISIPTSLGLFVVGGYTLLFLGRMLAASALGEPHHPRWPEWDMTAIAFGLGRWLLAGVVGGLVGGVPALLYWMDCGDIGPADALILGVLLTLGAAYALMALLASILHEDARAANPVTVVGAIVKLGWGYTRPCLVCAGAVLLGGSVFYTAIWVENVALSKLLLYGFWLVSLYATMVVFRVLGLFYGRNARALGWFRNPKRWGV